MFKVIWLLRRKPGITMDQFRTHYETSHARLAQKYFGDLLLSYKRNYKTGTWGGGVPTAASGDDAKGSGFGPVDWDYDCIVEWTMPDEAAFERINRLFADPVIGREFNEDEEHFLDRGSVMLFKCDMADSGTGDGAERPAHL